MDYIAVTDLTIDGEDMPDFKSFGEEEVELAMSVNVMRGTGTAEKTPRRRLNIEYVVPADKPEFDWEANKNRTITAGLEGGKRRTWTQCKRLTVGEAKLDGETEMTRTIVFQVKGRRIDE